MTDERKAVVRAGYDEIAGHFSEWSARITGDPRSRFLAEFCSHLKYRGRVLDLGCGAGVPSTRGLAERFDVVGVDVSEAQLRMAKTNVPEAMLVQADFSELALRDATFDGPWLSSRSFTCRATNTRVCFAGSPGGFGWAGSL